MRRYSLVSPAGDGLVQMNRLVAAITRAQLQTEVAAQWKQGAAALVDAAVPADPELPASWPQCAVMLPHARAVLDLRVMACGASRSISALSAATPQLGNCSN